LNGIRGKGPPWTVARIGWTDLPPRVRVGIEKVLGAAVISAESQPGGLSPGTADRVRTADGARAFVKAVSADVNADSAQMHRRESLITAALPNSVPAPRLLGCYDDGQWVALILEDVEGRQPATPWLRDDLDLVSATLHEMAQASTPAPLAGLASAAQVLGESLAGWQRLRDDPSPDLSPWTAARIDQFCTDADRARNALYGQTLVHLSVRSDNLLIDRDRKVTLVDWPRACTGPAWLDSLLLLINVRLFGGHDTQPMLADLAARVRADPADLTVVLVALAGFFLDGARRPAPPALPTVRSFQRAQGNAVLSWLQELGN
jgi:aminoglycoside phosphotransferase (APT) family kinase protein